MTNCFEHWISFCKKSVEKGAVVIPKFRPRKRNLKSVQEVLGLLCLRSMAFCGYVTISFHLSFPTYEVKAWPIVPVRTGWRAEIVLHFAFFHLGCFFFLGTLGTKLWRYLWVSIGEWHSNLCTIGEVRLTVKFVLRRTIGMELQQRTIQHNDQCESWLTLINPHLHSGLSDEMF